MAINDQTLGVYFPALSRRTERGRRRRCRRRHTSPTAGSRRTRSSRWSHLAGGEKKKMTMMKDIKNSNC